MRFSLIISFLVHSAILLAAIVVLPSPDEFTVKEQTPISVDIVEIEDVSLRRATKKDALPVPEEKVAPPKVEEVVKPEPVPVPEPEPEPVKTEPAPPDPKPLEELIKKTEPLPEPEPKTEPEPEPKKAENKPVPVPRRKPRVPKSFAEKKKKKHKFNPDQLTALLNKIDEEPKQRTDPADETGTPATGEIDSLIGSDARLSASEADWLRQKVSQCWNPPVGVREAATLIVKVRFEMDIDGTVLGTPRVINSSANPLFQVAADSAVRAVLGCQPYDRMPPEKYETWRDTIVNFDPRKMLAVN